MRIKNVKPGDIIHQKVFDNQREGKTTDLREENWKVEKVYRNLVLTRSVTCPAIKRCFNYGDLVMLKLESQNNNQERTVGGKWENYR